MEVRACSRSRLHRGVEDRRAVTSLNAAGRRVRRGAGLPPGVFNVLSGDGPVVGRHLGEHTGVDVLTFTGSTDVGRHFMRYSADSNLKRVYLELGGKSPNIILADAPDLDAAANSAAWAIFFNSGECVPLAPVGGPRRCGRQGSGAHRRYLNAVVSRRSTAAGHQNGATGRRTQPAARARASRSWTCRRRLAAGRRTPGARRDWRCLSRTDRGDWGGSRQPLVREEIFGPVLAVQVVRDEAEAVRVAGDTPYGLAAALWTSDLGTAHRVSRALRVGIVWVNCYEERHGCPVRRRQAVGLRPRQVSACA